jgi:Anti-sigma-K factor rskA, C-terminal
VSDNDLDFETLAGGADLAETDRMRLLLAHEAVVAAGPLAELPPHMAQAPQVEAEVVALPSGRRRSYFLAAAAVALVAFAIGTATAGKKQARFAAAWTQPMAGTALAPGAKATIAGTTKDSAGNWKMLFKTTGLPKVSGKQYYVLWLTKHGRPIVPCGSFLVGDGTTVATYVEPYEVHEFDGWAVTLWNGPKAPVGKPLLKTATI